MDSGLLCSNSFDSGSFLIVPFPSWFQAEYQVQPGWILTQHHNTFGSLIFKLQDVLLCQVVQRCTGRTLLRYAIAPHWGQEAELA